MKERPILFSGAMVRAILDGRKTQTRRIIKPHPHWINENNSVAHIGKKVGNVEYLCKYGQPGDRIFVRETFGTCDSYAPHIFYRADGEAPNKNFKWKPSIHMPRWASRITLEITGVRVERLQDISEDDALSEGLASVSKYGSLFKHGIPDFDGLPGNDNVGWPWVEWDSNPISAYKKLWESINGKGSWEENPWVWVITFRRVMQDGAE